MLGLVILGRFYASIIQKSDRMSQIIHPEVEENKRLSKKREIRILPSDPEGKRRWKSKNF